MFASLGMNEIVCEGPGLTNVIGFSSGQFSGFIRRHHCPKPVPWSTFQREMPTRGRVLRTYV